MPSGKTLALSATPSAQIGEAEEESVTCQYCKYLLEGAVLGDCRIIRWIGSGAFGDVYEAEQLPPLSRRVAIKVMAIERVVDGESAEMFAREVNTIAALDHPNILPVLRVGMIDDGRPYLVMKYAAQGSLQQFCQTATHTLNTPSLTPTARQASPVAPPADQLAIVAAETLNIAEIIEDTASEKAISTSATDEESVITLRKELPGRVEKEDSTIDDDAPSPDTNRPMPAMHTISSAHREEGAHLEKRPPANDSASSTSEQGSGRVSARVLTAEVGPDAQASNLVEEAETLRSISPAAPDPTSEAGAAPSANNAQSAAATPANGPAEPVVEATGEAHSLEKLADTPGTLEAIPQSAAGDAPESGQEEEQTGEDQAAPVGSHRTVPLVETPIAQAEAQSTELQATSVLLQATPMAEDQAALPIPQAEQAEETREVEHISTLILAGEVHPIILSPIPASPTFSLSLQQVLGYVEEAASALHYAHQRGLIHLDVKPANLLLDAQGRLMLADFGVSVLLEGYTHASLHYYVGTPLYTAPEQWLEQPRTASDQYALAVTCYQLLTGRPPFTGNLYAVMHGHLQASPPPMSQFNPLLPAQVEAVIRHALAKDPAERYPDMLAFARAFREAVEQAASADTDTQMQQRFDLLLEQKTQQTPLPDRLPPVHVSSDDLVEEQAASKKVQPEAGTFREEHAELPDERLRAGRGHWLRNLLLCVLALVLISGGSLSFVRSQRPCWLGICPRILLSSSAITLTNNETQPIVITNTGTDELHWEAAPHPTASWLSLSANQGTLAPGRSSKLIIKTNVDELNQSGVYTDIIDIAGGPGVATQTVEVVENVVKGLSAVSVNTSGQMFLYEQNKLQPGKQTITITNRSGHTLSWFTQYTDNNWLSVTPSQGNLKNGKSINLTVTVENPQNLANDTYQVRFSVVGQLDNQTSPVLLQTIDFSLQVNQSQTAQVAPTTPASPTAQPAQLSFTAQPVQASGAPGIQRFNHSMVWDAQDNQLLIFGGSNAQGNLLNDLWSFNLANGQWTNLTPANADVSASDCSGGSPAPRKSAAMVWDSTDRQVLLYGGIGSNNSYLGDLWAYSPAKNAWSVLACSGNAPGARGEAGAVWNGSQMLLLGGLGANGSLADFWAYTPEASGGWSQLAATTPLGARAFAAMSWDSHDRQLYVFGGLGANGQALGDFYTYQPDSGWSTIEASNGVAPMARQQALSAWDSKNRVFLLMGGWQVSNNSTYSALWAYSPADNAWWQITSLHNNGSTSVIPSRMASVMVWDSTDNRAYVYAGEGGENKAPMNDLWMIVPA